VEGSAGGGGGSQSSSSSGARAAPGKMKQSKRRKRSRAQSVQRESSAAGGSGGGSSSSKGGGMDDGVDEGEGGASEGESGGEEEGEASASEGGDPKIGDVVRTQGKSGRARCQECRKLIAAGASSSSLYVRNPYTNKTPMKKEYVVCGVAGEGVRGGAPRGEGGEGGTLCGCPCLETQHTHAYPYMHAHSCASLSSSVLPFSLPRRQVSSGVLVGGEEEPL
jgi:hypothetical protein